MIDILQFSFFQNALFIALLGSVVCGIMGTFIVVKRMSFISGSISHAAFGGIGIGYLLGISPLIGALGFGMLCSLALGFIRYKFKQQQDALIGAIWAVGMSVGILCLSLGSGYVGDVFGYLFGSILFGSRTDLFAMLMLNFFVILGISIFYYPLKAVTFDEDYAKTLNIPTAALYIFLLQLITVTIVLLLKMVGGILVIALLTMPAMAAKNLTHRLMPMMFISTLIALICSVGGLIMATLFSLPPGPLIVFVAAAVYILSLLKRQ